VGPGIVFVAAAWDRVCVGAGETTRVGARVGVEVGTAGLVDVSAVVDVAIGTTLDAHASSASKVKSTYRSSTSLHLIDASSGCKRSLFTVQSSWSGRQASSVYHIRPPAA